MKAVIDIEKTGKHLKEMCEKQNIRISDIQKELNLKCPQSIYRWFSGSALPTVDHLYTLACMLHVPIEELIVLKDESICDEHFNDILKWCSSKIKESDNPQKVYLGVVEIMVFPLE